jgi:hypothetical protein
VEVIHSLIHKVDLQGESGALFIFVGSRVQRPSTWATLDLFEHNAVGWESIAGT